MCVQHTPSNSSWLFHNLRLWSHFTHNVHLPERSRPAVYFGSQNAEVSVVCPHQPPQFNPLLFFPKSVVLGWQCGLFVPTMQTLLYYFLRILESSHQYIIGATARTALSVLHLWQIFPTAYHVLHDTLQFAQRVEAVCCFLTAFTLEVLGNIAFLKCLHLFIGLVSISPQVSCPENMFWPLLRSILARTQPISWFTRPRRRARLDGAVSVRQRRCILLSSARPTWESLQRQVAQLHAIPAVLEERSAWKTTNSVLSPQVFTTSAVNPDVPPIYWALPSLSCKF